MSIPKSIISKYNIVFNGKKRLYLYPLPERGLNLENTVPNTFVIGHVEITSTSWVELLALLVKFLVSVHPKNDEELLNFKTDWSKTNIFRKEKRINHEFIREGIYLNENHTAQHSIWLMIDLLDFFGEDYNNCKLIIRRHPRAEPDEVRNWVIKETKQEFETYLKNVKQLDQPKTEFVLKNIDILNKFMAKQSSAYDNLYLIDDATTFGALKPKIIEGFASSSKDYEKYKAAATKFLGYLTSFFRDNGYYNKK